jgi:mycofactocin precursor
MIETMTDKTTATNTKLPTHRTDNDPQPTSSVAENAQLIAEEILIEEVSIDGMCGVY